MSFKIRTRRAQNIICQQKKTPFNSYTTNYVLLIQLKYLAHAAVADFTKLERQYKPYGCELNLTHLHQTGEFRAPPDLYSKINDNLEALTQIKELPFEVDEPGFEVLVSKNKEQLLATIKSKCYLEKNIETRRIDITVPKSRVANLEKETKNPQSDSATANFTSVTIGSSTITIIISDLTVQSVSLCFFIFLILLLQLLLKYMLRDNSFSNIDYSLNNNIDHLIIG